MRLILSLAILLLWTLPLMAETYSWVDGQGTVNFTDDYSQIPRKYRSKVNKRGDVSPAQPVQAPKRETSDTGGKIIKEADPRKPAVTTGAPAELSYGGKKAAEWQRAFRERDAELERLDGKVREISEIRKTARGSGPEMMDLFKKHRDAQEQYNESVKRFNELNDAANAAGVPAEFRK